MAYYDFDTILTRMLTRVPTARDKRQGSIIYDTLAPTAVELVQANITATIFGEQVVLLTAVGDNLDKLAVNYGFTRNVATSAIRIGEMYDTNGNPIDVNIGSRFSIPATSGGYNFTVIASTDTIGQCLLACETLGTAGNAYIGSVLPLFTVNSLGMASIIGTYTPGEDVESDDELRARIQDSLTDRAFAGNVSAYREFTKAIAGVGDVKVFPAWDGGGTVMLSIVDGNNNPVTPDFIDVVQKLIDPINL